MAMLAATAALAVALACVLFGPRSAQAQTASSAGSVAAPAYLTITQYEAAMARVQADCIAAAASEGAAADSARAVGDLTRLLHIAVLQPAQSGSAASLVYADNRPLMGQMEAAGLAQAAGGRSAGEMRAAQWQKIGSEIAQVRDSLPQAQPGAVPLDAHASAAKVLAGPDFASDPIPPKSIWERMGDAIDRWLSKLHFPHPSGGPAPITPISPVVPELILIVICAAAIGLIVYFTVVWLRERGERRTREARAAKLDLAFTAEEKELVATHNYARLRSLAGDAAAIGDFRSAYRLVFLAILVYLDTEGAIRLDQAKTNWEYLRSMSADSGLPEILRPVIREFDRIWYGQRPALQREYELAGEAYTAIQARIEGERAGAGKTGAGAQPALTGAGTR